MEASTKNLLVQELFEEMPKKRPCLLLPSRTPLRPFWGPCGPPGSCSFSRPPSCSPIPPERRMAPSDPTEPYSAGLNNDLARDLRAPCRGRPRSHHASAARPRRASDRAAESRRRAS